MQRTLILASAMCVLVTHSTSIFADDNLPDNLPSYCDGTFDNSGDNDAGYRGELDDCVDYNGDGSSILGILPSDHCFDRFVSPLSNPFFFEDPRSLTEAQGIFLDNSLPSSIGGGDAQVWATQIRLRLSDRWSLIAPQLGELEVNQSQGGGAPHGFMSAPVGFKYNFFRDPERQSLLSGGMTYFIPGSASAFSNFGDGDVHFFLTGGQEIFEQGHWLSATGVRLPIDRNWGTPLWYWSNQWDYEVVDHWYGVFGTNWFHWMGSGGLQSSVTALDLIDIPAAGVAGTDVATCAAGIKWKPSNHLEFGTGFEVPLTERTDILRNRLYADLIFRY
jgi:hypothetical protein